MESGGFMKGISKPGFQSASETQTAGKTGNRSASLNRATSFQAALTSAKNKQFEEKKKETKSFSPAPTPPPASNQSAPAPSVPSSSSQGGFAAPAGNSTGGSLRGHLAGSSGFRDDSEQRVEQELNNQLIQSGLQAQTLKGDSGPSNNSD